MDAAIALTENIVRVDYENIPLPVVAHTKKDILDTLGVVMSGSRAPGTKEVVELVVDWGGKPESTILSYGHRVPAPYAAFVNSVMASALDYYDTHDAAVIHAGSSVVPGALAVAERKGKVTGTEFITAVALGLDLICRLGLAITKPGGETGWSYTSILASFGVCAAASKILNLDREKMLNALGIALCQSAGTLQGVREGAQTKQLGQGLGTKAGVFSALMAAKGNTGGKNSLEGEAGLYNVHLRGSYNPSVLTSELGKRFEGLNISFKPYPCCRYIHPFIEATLGLVTECDVKPGEVHEIIVYVGASNMHVVEPLDRKRVPHSELEAQFSLPYAVASVISRRGVSIGDYSDEGIRDPAVLELAHKVTPRIDMEIVGREIAPAVVEIKRNDGKVLRSKQVAHAKGHPKNPMSMDQLIEKFRDCVSYSVKPVSEENVTRVIQVVDDLEDVQDVGKIAALLT